MKHFSPKNHESLKFSRVLLGTGKWRNDSSISSKVNTPEIIEGVELILEEAIKTVKDSTVQDQLQAGIDMIREIQEAEKKEQIQEKSTEELDILKNFI